MEITNLHSFFSPQFFEDMNIQESQNQGFVVGVEHIPSTTCCSIIMQQHYISGKQAMPLMMKHFLKAL
jgi:hypothetical protein